MEFGGCHYFSPRVHDKAAFERLRQAETIGHPLGGKAFIEAPPAHLGREPAPTRRGKRKREEGRDAGRTGY